MSDERDRAFLEERISAYLGGDPRAAEPLLPEDFVKEFPQSGERIRGRSNAMAMDAANPMPPQLIGLPRMTWCGDEQLLVEARQAYPDGAWWIVALYDVEGRTLRREAAYYGAPFPAPPWRTPYVVPIPEGELTADPGGHQAVDRELVDRYFVAFAANDFAALQRLRHAAFVSDMPQSGERYPSHAKQVAAEENYPGGLPEISNKRLTGASDAWTVGPSFSVLRVSGRGAHWACEALLTYPSGERSHAVTVLEYRDGLVIRERNYFCSPFEAAAWRAAWVDPA
jgi:hypothetical protein